MTTIKIRKRYQTDLGWTFYQLDIKKMKSMRIIRPAQHQFMMNTVITLRFGLIDMHAIEKIIELTNFNYKKQKKLN